MSETAPTTDERAMPITALAPWFGAKRILAAQIVAEFGEHRTYWEPFAGSMAVLMAKPPVSMETVNDLHRDLINLACVVRDQKMGPRLYRMLRRTLMHEDLFDESDAFMREVERTGIAGLPEGLPRKMVERAYNFFVVSWMGRNGCAGQPSNKKGTYCARFTNKGGHAATRWHKAVSSIAAWRRRLAHVTILRRDAFELLERIDDASGTVIYCDPPYIEKGGRYLHDFALTDHERLAAALVRFRSARVVVSYYQHERLAAMYPGWTLRNLKATKALVSAGRRDSRGRVDAPEVLLINGPSLVESTDAPLLEGCS